MYEGVAYIKVRSVVGENAVSITRVLCPVDQFSGLRLRLSWICTTRRSLQLRAVHTGTQSLVFALNQLDVLQMFGFSWERKVLHFDHSATAWKWRIYQSLRPSLASSSSCVQLSAQRVSVLMSGSGRKTFLCQSFSASEFLNSELLYSSLHCPRLGSLGSHSSSNVVLMQTTKSLPTRNASLLFWIPKKWRWFRQLSWRNNSI